MFSPGGFSEPVYPFAYNKAYVFEPRLSHSDNTRLLLLRLIGWLFDVLHTNGVISASVEGNADLLAVDAQGRRTGYIDTEAYNEIPGATVSRIEGMQALLLPIAGDYELRTTASAAGRSGAAPSEEKLTLTITDPLSSEMAQVIEYQDVRLAEGSQATVTFIHGQTHPLIVLPGGTAVLPDISEQVSDPMRMIYLPLIRR